MPAYEVRPRKDHRGVDLISDALPFGPRGQFLHSKDQPKRSVIYRNQYSVKEMKTLASQM
jgi:hypothetical protein